MSQTKGYPSYQARFQMNNSKLLLNCPPQDSPPLLKATFSLQGGLVRGRLLYYTTDQIGLLVKETRDHP